MKKKILVIAMPESIHAVRWLNQITEQGWEIHLFPSLGGRKFHPEFDGIIAHYWFHSKYLKKNVDIGKFMTFMNRALSYIRCAIVERLYPDHRAKQLSKLIEGLRPDLIHTLEFQSSGYLTLSAKKYLSSTFPKWIATNWGSDIYLFGRLKAHREKIKEVLLNCDYYSCECERDIKLAKELDFNGIYLPVFPNTGGFDLDKLRAVRQAKTSQRKRIMLKGYQHWAGRSLVGLRALERCADLLGNYEIDIYSASNDVIIASELFTNSTGIVTNIVDSNTPHEKILELHAQARISIGLSISDAISTSLLEAMVMGSFPIQSCTSCADEWFEHGKSGMIVPAEDPDIIEMALRIALSDDELVDTAAEINWETALKRLNESFLKQKALDMYSSILQSNVK
jgi:glycosyltransferase involved in cell wall biosynthesis